MTLEPRTSRASRLASLRWPRPAAIVFCGLLGVFLPSAFGALTGIPRPLVHDEFSYLLGADTLARGRLTNASPPLPEFFEAPHVLVVPSYASKYPPAQAVVLAVGQLSGRPIWGVWLSCGLFAAALCWMLQAWTSRKWAVATTVLSIATLGTASYWAQSYWGGMVPATGAALCFGGLRRYLRTPRASSAVLCASGAVVLASSRPFEGLLVCAAAAMILACRGLGAPRWAAAAREWRVWFPGFALLAVGLVGLLLYNQAVTGSPLRAPYALHLNQYFRQGVFHFSPKNAPTRTPAGHVERFYRRNSSQPEQGSRLIARAAGQALGCLLGSLGAAFGVLEPPPLDGRQPFRGGLVWLVVLGSLWIGLRARWVAALAVFAAGADVAAWRLWPAFPGPVWAVVVGAWAVAGIAMARSSANLRVIVGTTLLVIVAQSLVRWWLPHYASPIVPLILAVVAMTSRRIVRSPAARSQARLVGQTVGIAAAVHLIVLGALAGSTRNPALAAQRAATASHASVSERLTRAGGRHLVFVKYAADFSSDIEWVYNSADLQADPVLFAHDLGGASNQRLVSAFPNRAIWLAHVSREGVRLEAYPVQPGS